VQPLLEYEFGMTASSTKKHTPTLLIVCSIYKLAKTSYDLWGRYVSSGDGLNTRNPARHGKDSERA